MKKYIQPALHIVLLQHQSHLLVDSVQKLESNVGFTFGGASTGDVESRTKENDWGDIWDE